VVVVGAKPTTRLKVLGALEPFALVAITWNVVLPGAAGIPEITPVAVLRVNPAGGVVPPANDHVTASGLDAIRVTV